MKNFQEMKNLWDLPKQILCKSVESIWMFLEIFSMIFHKSLEKYFATIALDLKMGNFKPSS
jgi:hypothetical protein